MTPETDSQTWIKSNLIDSVARVDLRVQSMDAAIAFYRDVVGLEVATREGDTATLRAPGGPVILRLDSKGVTAPADPHATGLFHTAFRFPTRATLGGALARVGRAELELGAGDHLVSEALYVDDPDGNGVELYWDRPASEWPPPSEDARVPMATLPVDLDGLYRASLDEAAPDHRAPEGTDVGHVHLQVSDVEQTSRFYGDVLGLDLTAHLGRSAAFLSSKGYHHNIGANAWRSQGGKGASPNTAGLSRVVFGVSDRTELEQLADRLRAEGTDATITADRITVADPDGIELQFELTGASAPTG